MPLRPVYVRALRYALAVLLCAQVVALASAIASPATRNRNTEYLAASSDDVSAADEPAPTPSASTTSSTSTGESPPAVTPTVDGPAGNAGWYVGDVNLSWTIVDDDTPVTSTDGCDPASVIADTAGDTFTCTATSDGGTTTTTVTIARDATAPADVIVTPERAPDAGGTYNHAFNVAWSGADATSGIASCSSIAYAGPDTDAGSIDGSCTDVAGNTSASVPFAFAYDASAPVVTGTADRAPDHGDWFNAPVTITWTSDDPGATCDAPTAYAGPDAAATTLTGSCTDTAGNVGTGTFDLAYDATGPVITIVTPAEDGVYILREPVAADYACTDDTAGIESCVGTVADGAALDTATVGAKAFEVTATDAAGNTATVARGYAVQYAQGTVCGGGLSHQILQPIAADGSSAFNHNRTVPAKFRVCDFFGKPVASAGVVSSFRLTSIDGLGVDQDVPSTSADESFRTGGGQWIFTIATKPFEPGSAYGFTIALDDGTELPFGFALD